MANNTVFGTDPLPYSVQVYSDATPYIEAGNIFYLTDENGPAFGWTCKGGRVWVPNDAQVTGRSITITAYVGGDFSGIEVGLSTPTRQEITTTPAGGGWCEVLWDTPFLLDYGPKYSYVIITYRFNDPADAAKYIGASSVSTDAIPSVDVGSSLVLAPGDTDGMGYTWNKRGMFNIGGIQGSYTSYYGIDIIMDETPAPQATLPIAAYGFNEASGTIINDTTGNGYDLETAPQYFTPDGHYDHGLQQIDTSSALANSWDPGTFTAVDIVADAQFTLMFWGKRSSNAAGTDIWTVRQTTANQSTDRAAWGIKMSDGVNTAFFVDIQGYPTTQTAPHQPLDEWHHYALVTTGSFVRGYIDGQNVVEYGASGIYGSTPDYNFLIFEGAVQGQMIDDLRLFRYALDPVAIQYYMGEDVTEGTRSGKVKVWSGATWEAHPLKVWSGSAWVTRPANGTDDGATFVKGKG